MRLTPPTAWCGSRSGYVDLVTSYRYAFCEWSCVAVFRPAIRYQVAPNDWTPLRQVTAARVSMLPHEIQRLGAVPIGVGLAWLGYDHWAKVRSHPSALSRSNGST